MAIVPFPGSPLYEEMVRRQMKNQVSANPAPQNSYQAGQGPMVTPNYQNFRDLAQSTGTNYGYVEGMLQRDPSMAAKFGYTQEGFQNQTGAGFGGGGPGGGGGKGGPGGGGVDPALLSSINAAYDRSRLSHMGTSRAMEKRMRGDFNERFGGAETGLLYGAEREERGRLGETLALNEDQRNMALASARERAEERKLRAQEAAARRAMQEAQMNAAAYSRDSSYNSKDNRGGSGGGGGYSDPGAYGGGDRYSSRDRGGLGGGSRWNPATGKYESTFKVGVDTRGGGGQYTKDDWYASSPGVFGARFGGGYGGAGRYPGGGGGGPPGAPPPPGSPGGPEPPPDENPMDEYYFWRDFIPQRTPAHYRGGQRTPGGRLLM